MTPELENTSVREAVCEFHFHPNGPWDPDTLRLFSAELRGEYPKRLSSQVGIAETIAVGPEQQRQPVPDTDELRIWRDSDDGVIVLKPYSLAVRYFRPYPSWEAYRPIIERVLEVYLQVARPSGIQRIGLRFVNEFYFRNPSQIQLENAFDFYPFIGDRLGQEPSSFVVGVQYTFENNRDVLRVQMQPERVELTEIGRVMLDLNYYLAPSGRVALDEIGHWIDQAHQRIQTTVEGCLKL